jgi:hypothetical protein
VCVCVCVGEIISLPWFSKELKNDLSKNNCLRGVILILLVRESIFVRWGSLFSIVNDLGTSYLCVTLLSYLIYLTFRELVSLRVGCMTQCVITRFASFINDETCISIHDTNRYWSTCICMY